MASFIAQSDFTIITPSVIANEIIYMNKPIISIKVTPNQKFMHKYLKQKNHHTMKKFNYTKLTKAIHELI